MINLWIFSKGDSRLFQVCACIHTCGTCGVIVDGSDEPPTSNPRAPHQATKFTMVIPVTSIQLEHIPRPHSVHLALFKNVQNAAFLRDQLLAGNTDFEYAFIDATTVSG